MVLDPALPRAVLACDAAVLGVLGALAYYRRDRPGALPFAAATATAGVAALALAGFGAVGGPRSASWAVTASLFLVFVTAWAWFVARYTGEAGVLSGRPLTTVAPLPALGILTLGYLFATGRPIPRSLPTGDPFYVLLFTLPLVLVAAIFSGSLLLLALAGVRYASTRPPRTVALIVGALGAGVLPVIFVALFPPGDEMALVGHATGYTSTAAGFWLAVGRYNLLDATPLVEAIGRESLVGGIEDLVVVVDRDHCIADMNGTAEAAFEISLAAAVGDPVTDYLAVPEDLGLVETIEAVEVDEPDGRHVYEASVSALDQGGRPVGYALVLREVTDRRTRRQRLEALNRVLRHNLRNDMTTVLGYADLLADETGDVEPIERIRRTADSLAELGDKASEIERLMAAAQEDDGETKAGRLVQYVAEEARKRYPEADVVVSLDGDARIAASERVCWPVVWNLVENAVEHNDRERPGVGIRLGLTDEVDPRARVVVRDDGPGIPETDRTAIDAGTEGPLSHGSGLGLWTVKWGANRVGGEVTIAEREDRGTEVTVTFPVVSVDRLPSEHAPDRRDRVE